MSQYPSPYSSPTPPQGPLPYMAGYSDPRAPGRRAGVLMIVLGSLGLLCGLCSMPVLFMNNDAMMAQQSPEIRSLMAQSGSSTARAWILGVLIAVSLLNLIVGVLCLRGSKGAAIGGIVLGAISTLYFLLDALVGAALAASGNAAGLLVVGVSAVALVVFIFQLLWSISAAKASSKISQTDAAYQAQYWQYLQQQQMYQQAYNQNPYSAPPAGGQSAANQGWQWPGGAQPQMPAPPPPPPTDGGPHGQPPQ